MTMQDYIEIMHPKKFKEAISRIAKGGDSQQTVRNVVLAQLISFIAFAITSILPVNMTALASADAKTLVLMAQLQKMMLTPIGAAITFVIGIVMFYFLIAALNTLCSIMGGKGKLNNLLYSFSVLNLTYGILTAPLSVISQINVISCFAGTLSILIGIYAVYLYYRIVREIHKELSTVKSIIAIVAYAIITSVLAGVVLGIRVMIGI